MINEPATGARDRSSTVNSTVTRPLNQPSGRVVPLSVLFVMCAGDAVSGMGMSRWRLVNGLTDTTANRASALLKELGGLGSTSDCPGIWLLMHTKSSAGVFCFSIFEGRSTPTQAGSGRIQSTGGARTSLISVLVCDKTSVSVGGRRSVLHLSMSSIYSTRIQPSPGDTRRDSERCTALAAGVARVRRARLWQHAAQRQRIGDAAAVGTHAAPRCATRPPAG